MTLYEVFNTFLGPFNITVPLLPTCRFDQALHARLRDPVDSRRCGVRQYLELCFNRRILYRGGLEPDPHTNAARYLDPITIVDHHFTYNGNTIRLIFANGVAISPPDPY